MNKYWASHDRLMSYVKLWECKPVYMPSGNFLGKLLCIAIIKEDFFRKFYCEPPKESECFRIEFDGKNWSRVEETE